MFDLKKQLKGLYLSSVLGNLSLTGAWVAILSARGYSLAEIGIAETVFHITSLIFEIPSGVLADIFGRKKMLIISSLLRAAANIVMILSSDLFTVCISIALHAMSYNFASGSGDALAYDSMKTQGEENRFENYTSNQLTIYRVCSGISTLCAGLALFIGHRLAYGTDLITVLIQIAVLGRLREIKGINLESDKEKNILYILKSEFISCFKESFSFILRAKKAILLMLANSLVGAADILLLFFLQAKLPQAGIPEWGLGIALLFMELGGVLGAKLILRFPRLKYRTVFVLTFMLVSAAVLLEHTGIYTVMTLAGFVAAMSDDALQVRTNARLQDMFPSEQRATLISIESFTFSVLMIVLSPLAGLFFTLW